MKLKRRFPVGLLAFQGEMHAEWSVLLAGLTISAIPIIVFSFLHKDILLQDLEQVE